MPIVKPFNAIRYAAGPGGDLGGLIAPPYDVLGEADKQAMLAGNPHNIVAIDLPHTPPKSLGPAEAYQRSAKLLDRWLADGVLVREADPAVWAYQQTFEQADRAVTRRGFIAVVAAEQLAASPTGIFPHEQTFGGPKEDRLALTKATRAQISPIFGLFADEGNAITDKLYAGLARQPDLAGKLGEVVHEAWRVSEPAKVTALTAALAQRPLFIADGHHRYGTALNYLAELEKQGPVPADHPARFVMFVCVSMDDPGLVIWPTHRVLTVRPISLDALAARLAGVFELTATDASAEQLERTVCGRGPGWFAIKTSEGAARLLRLINPAVLDKLAPGRSDAYRRLDVAILHRFLIDEAIKPLAGEPMAIEYPHTGADMAAALASRSVSGSASFDASASAGGPASKLAVITAPTPLSAVRDVCLAGELMPQKSTFFYPKLATGMTLYRHF